MTQRAALEDEEPLQGRFDVAQRASLDDEEVQMKQPPSENATGMPDRLKAGIESLSGIALDDVRVHYNSPQPAQLGALAYAQGTDIHVAPGQERHLPHEAWHIVQQAQGRVRPTMQMQHGVPVNDDQALEREADAMGARAVALPALSAARAARNVSLAHDQSRTNRTIQRELRTDDFQSGSASSQKKLKGFLKNPEWEIGFRKLSNTKPGAFDLKRENDAILELDKKRMKQAIPINHSMDGIAISRNPDFVMDVLTSGTRKVVVVVAIPEGFGVDLEAEYLKHYAKKHKGARPDEYIDPKQVSRLSQEVTVSRMPAGCVYGWIEQNLVDDGTHQLEWIRNPDASCPAIEKIDRHGRFKRLMTMVHELKDVKRIGFEQ